MAQSAVCSKQRIPMTFSLTNINFICFTVPSLSCKFGDNNIGLLFVPSSHYTKSTRLLSADLLCIYFVTSTCLEGYSPRLPIWFWRHLFCKHWQLDTFRTSYWKGCVQYWMRIFRRTALYLVLRKYFKTVFLFIILHLLNEFGCPLFQRWTTGGMTKNQGNNRWLTPSVLPHIGHGQIFFSGTYWPSAWSRSDRSGLWWWLKSAPMSVLVYDKVERLSRLSMWSSSIMLVYWHRWYEIESTPEQKL